MRRLWAIGILVVAVLGAQVALPAAACACGAIARSSESTVAVRSERAIISHADGVEQIDLLLDLESAALDTGLVFPTPTPAKVTQSDLSEFDAVEAAIVPRPDYVDDWWGIARAPRSTTSEPEVISTVQLGPLEATTLRASNSKGLNAWLKSNKYAMTNASSKLISTYVDKGWSFVALKLTGKQELNGTIDPVRFTFDSNKIVYPVRFSAATEEPQSLRVYVLNDNRVDARQDSAAAKPLNASRTTVWAGPVNDRQLRERGRFLTVIDLAWDNPKAQIDRDIAFVDVPSNDQVIPTTIVVRPVTLLGVPVGLLVVGWAFIGLVIFLGALVARTRTR